MNPLSLGKLYPHERIYGPIFIPISLETIHKNMPFETNADNKKPKVGFKGTLYPERSYYLEALKICANELDLQITTEGKKFVESNESYWDFINQHDIIFTTTVQTNINKEWVDNLNVNQMVFRISEAIALGKVLVTTKINGLDKFFVRNIDFIEIDDSIEIKLALTSALEKATITLHSKNNSNRSFLKLVENRCFWRISGIKEVGICSKTECGCLRN
jgi:hypothetical protein